MKRIFAWIIMSLMSITAVMPSFIPFANQNETPSVVQVEKEEEKENITPTVVPDEPTPEPEQITEPETTVEEMEYEDEAIDLTTAVSFQTKYNEEIARRTAELNADIYETLKVPTTSEDYRGNELPSGYTQIEYLESTGKQWIDTNVCPDYKTNFEIDFLTTNTLSSSYNVNGSGYGYIFGSDGARLSLNTYPATNGGELYYFNRAINPYITSGVRTQISLIGNVFTTSNGVQNIDRGSFSASSTTLKVFSKANGGDCAHVKLYSFKIYDNETLVRDYIPCYDSNKVFGLYDVVGNQFYTNQGSGVFNVLQTYTHTLQGSGTESDPYLINDEYDFYYMRNCASGSYIKLTNDIHLNYGRFEMNESTGNIEYHSRKGKDDGLYKWAPLSKTNFNINGDGHNVFGIYEKGLFYAGWATTCLKNSTIENLNITNSYVYSSSHLGMLTGQIENCTIRNCSVDGWGKAGYGIGGIAFNAISSQILACTNYMHIIHAEGQYGNAGICGSASNSLIENCVNYGNNTSKAYMAAAMISNPQNTKVVNCKNYGNVTVDTYTGGIGYYGSGEFINCENHGVCSVGISGGGIIKNCTNYAACTSSGIGGYRGTPKLIENCENYGECPSGIGSATTIRNCKNYKLKSSGGTGIGSATTIESCINYANVENGSSCTGIGSGTTISNCTNYGNVNVSGAASGIGDATNIIDCVNYGNLISTNGNCAGVIANESYGRNKNINISNCKNFGTIKGTYAGGFIASWFANDCSNDSIKLYKCINSGEITGTYVGGLIGQRRSFQKYSSDIIIQNCINEGCLKGTYVGGFIGETRYSYYADNIVCLNSLNTGDISGSTAGIFVGKNSNLSGMIENCINLGCINKSSPALVYDNSRVQIYNVIINCKAEESSFKKYYGSDFSAFFLTWKDARIGLISLESTGLYRGKLTEKYLYEHGFEPQDHVYTGGLSDLNDEFYKLKYLESTGTQRIDTGVIPTNTMKFVLESNFTSGAMGSSVGGSSKTIFDFRSSAVLTYGEGKSHTYTKRNQKQKFIIDYLNSKTSCDEDENNFVSTPKFGNSTFTIFTWHEGGYYYNTSGKFYSLKIYDNETLVRDFVPAMRKSDNVIGLYDKVEGKFYTNQGSGSFIGG